MTKSKAKLPLDVVDDLQGLLSDGSHVLAM